MHFLFKHFNQEKSVNICTYRANSFMIHGWVCCNLPTFTQNDRLNNLKKIYSPNIMELYSSLSLLDLINGTSPSTKINGSSITGNWSCHKKNCEYIFKRHHHPHNIDVYIIWKWLYMAVHRKKVLSLFLNLVNIWKALLQPHAEYMVKAVE